MSSCVPKRSPLGSAVPAGCSDFLRRVVIDCEATLQQWLNAYEYHKNGNKRREVERLHQLLPLEASRAIFVTMLYDKVDAIHHLHSRVRLMLGKQVTWTRTAGWEGVPIYQNDQPKNTGTRADAERNWAGGLIPCYDFHVAHPTTKARLLMVQSTPSIDFEDVPLDEARRMSRGPRMDPELYHALKEKIESLNNTAARMTIPEGTNPTTMKNRILRMAIELGMSVTVRKVPGGLLFWRSTDEDRHQAREVVARLQAARQPPQPTRQGRRRRG